MLIFQIWTVVTGLVLLVLGFRTRKFSKSLTLLQDLPAHVPESYRWPKLSIVIPACNEGDTIEAAMESLLAVDYPNLEIIVINDRSNDATREIIDQLSLMDPRIKPVHVNYLPDGWLGKVNALDRGINMTTADWILLSDADVHFAAQSLKSAVAFCIKDRIDFMTVIPDVITRSPILHVVIAQLFHQASLFFRPDKINDPRHRACYGQGAFMLLRKSTYLRSMRLEWLKMEVVDDTGLALLMRRAGARMAAVSGKNQIQLEWYPTFKSFTRGIEKNAFAFSQYSLPILLGFTSVVYLTAFGFLVAPFLAGHAAFSLFTMGCMAFYLRSVHLQLNKILHLKSWTALALPAASVFLPFLFLRASFLTMKRGGVNWRGTFYELSDLKANQRMKLANLVFNDADTKAPILNSASEKEAEDTSSISRAA
jgi:cellulose synthase/poly-beta-1,6-N-acetylglucosamine synthase-like glycosyltransferase